MADSINNKLRLTQDVYNASKHLTTNMMSQNQLFNTNQLSSIVTQLYGGINNALPLLLMTEGDPANGGMVQQPKSIDGTNEYQILVFGKVKTFDTIARTGYADNAELGKAGQRFKLIFSSNWLLSGHTIQEGSTQTQARIVGDAVKVAGGYEYTCELLSTNPAAFLPAAAFQKNARWASIGYVVALEGSVGTNSHRRLPSRMTNQYSAIRKSYSIKGNAGNKVINIQIPMGNGKTTNMWSNFEIHERRREFLKEMDDLCIWSRYNRVNGEILEKDERGNLIPRFSGLLEQIPNVDTYSFLTEAKIDWIITNILHNIGGYGDAVTAKEVTLKTGLGGAKEFDRAMKEAGVTAGFTQFLNNTLVGGSASNSTDLTYGTYFGSYKHRKGYVVNIMINDAFDRGPIPDASPRHPVTGLSLESYKMLFLDTSVYDGQKNIQFVNEKGREYMEKYILGFTAGGILGFDSKQISTSVDESSVEFFKTIGMHLLRPTNCFVLNYALD